MPLRWIAVLGALSMLLPATVRAQQLSCVAAYEMVCAQKKCRSAAVTGAVRLTIDPASGRGELCTYTYCRAFVLLQYRKYGRAAQTVGGLVVSAQRGSTPPRSKEPEVGMLLTVDLKTMRFGLTDGSATGVSGWFGRCK